MEPKDIATLTIGCSALLLSIVALVQKLNETKRTMRIQLTDTLNKEADLWR